MHAETNVRQNVRSDEIIWRGEADLELHVVRYVAFLTDFAKHPVRLDGLDIVLCLQLRHALHRLAHFLISE